MRIAAIDVGTNTALLLVAEVAVDGTLVPLCEARRFIRLGEGVDAARRVSEAAMRPVAWPTTISVEPPPMSMTAQEPPRPSRAERAPRKLHVASSKPVRIS